MVKGGGGGGGGLCHSTISPFQVSLQYKSGLNLFIQVHQCLVFKIGTSSSSIGDGVSLFSLNLQILEKWSQFFFIDVPKVTVFGKRWRQPCTSLEKWSHFLFLEHLQFYCLVPKVSVFEALNLS